MQVGTRIIHFASRYGRRYMAVIAGLAVGITGVVYLTGIRASGPFESTEAERGMLSGSVSIQGDTGASGGAHISFGVAGTKTSSSLPFTLPSQATLKASSKKVFAHYFTQFPVSIDNKPSDQDYYAVQYLNPHGESDKFLASGGFLRDRPMPRPVSSLGDPAWKLEDKKNEVRTASNAGLDGFTLDILSTSGYHWDASKQMLDAAAAADPNFKIMLMPDAAALPNDSAALAAAVASVANHPAVFKLPDGRLVISPFYAENFGATWWQNWLNTMKNQYGINIAFVPCFLNYGASRDAFAPFSYGFSNWGDRSPANNTNEVADINDAHSRGKIWMQPVSLQDTRPHDGTYWEALNSENLRITWNAALSGAEWVQIPTWNDYSENAQVAPSPHIGWAPLDISSYYMTWYKQGSAPAITRDVLYLSHRIQPYAAVPTGGQTLLMTLNQFSSPSRDAVEVLSFLTAPATINVKVGANTYSYSAPAGLFAKTYPLATGEVSATVHRTTDGATVTSPFPVVDRPPIQDLD